MDVNRKLALGVIALVFFVIIVSIILVLLVPSDREIALDIDESISLNSSEIPVPEEVVEEITREEEDLIQDFISPFTEVLSVSARQNLEEGQVAYLVKLESTWSRFTHPNWFREDVFISPFVVWSHSRKDVGFKLGGYASDALKNLAETNSTLDFLSEIERLRERFLVFEYNAGGILNPPGEQSIILVTSREYPYLSAVASLSLGGDWLLGIQNVRLLNNNNWIKSTTIPVKIYEAGSVVGDSLDSKGVKIDDTDRITELSNAPFNPIARFSISLLED